MKYKIFKKQRYNDYGKVESTRFIIKKRKNFIGICYWKNVVDETWPGNDAKIFSSVEDAKKFIKEVLCPNLPREKWVETPIEEILCK